MFEDKECPLCASRNISFSEREHALVCRDCGSVIAGTPVALPTVRGEVREIVHEKDSKRVMKMAKPVKKVSKPVKRAKKVVKKAKKPVKKVSKKAAKKSVKKSFMKRLLRR